MSRLNDRVDLIWNWVLIISLILGAGFALYQCTATREAPTVENEGHEGE